MTNPRLITSALETYQKARHQFAQSVSDLAQRAQNCALLVPALPLLAPLLGSSATPGEVHLAALAISRMAQAGYAAEICAAGLIADLVNAMDGTSKMPQSQQQQQSASSGGAAMGCRGRAISAALKNIAKHSKKLAQSVVDAGALPKLVQCLEEFDPGTRESAAQCLATLAQHDADLAWSVVRLGVLQALLSTLQEPELALRVSAAQCLGSVAQQGAELAQAVVDIGAVFLLANTLDSSTHDARLRRTVLHALAAVAQHGSALAEAVVEADVYPGALLLLKDPDEGVRRAAMDLVRHVSRQSADLAQLLVSIGAIGATVDYLDGVLEQQVPGVVASSGVCARNGVLPALLTLGFVAAHSERLAQSVISARAVTRVAKVSSISGDAEVRSTATWTLGQIGQHSAEHARALALTDGVLSGMLECTLDQKTGHEKWAAKSREALKIVLQRCTELPALQPLFIKVEQQHEVNKNADENDDLRTCLLAQFAKVLPTGDANHRKTFVTSGCLKTLQEAQLASGSLDKQYRIQINQCFPPEIIKYYSPGYPDDLLSRVEQFGGPSTATSATTESGKV